MELPNHAYLQLCIHSLPCLSAAPAVLAWSDPRVITPPQPLPVAVPPGASGSVGVLSSPPASEDDFGVDEELEAAFLNLEQSTCE